MLQTRKNRVIIVTPTTSYEINLIRDEALNGVEIEEKIVADIVSAIILVTFEQINYMRVETLILFNFIQLHLVLGTKA